MDAIQKRLRRLQRPAWTGPYVLEYTLTNCPLLPVAISLIAGILTAEYTPLPYWLFTAVLIIVSVTAVVLSFSGRSGSSGQTFTLLLLACGAAWCAGGLRLTESTSTRPNDISNFIQGPALVTVKGTVLTEPVLEDRDRWQFGSFQWTAQSSSFYLELDKVKSTAPAAKDGFAEITGKVRVHAGAPLTEIGPGDYILVHCTVDRFPGPDNPGVFDVRKYMKRNGVIFSAFVKSAISIEMIEKSSRSPIARFKSRLSRMAQSGLIDPVVEQSPNTPILAALLLGERQNIEKDTYLAFRRTGLAHFISLSGLHMGIIAGFVWLTLRLTPLPRAGRAAAAILIISLYAFILPARAPTIRAAVISIFFFLSIAAGRRTNPLNTLSLAAIILLVINPTEVFGASWQLSFTAVLGIIVLYEPIYNFFETPVYRLKSYTRQVKKSNAALKALSLLGNFVEKFLQLLSVGLAASLGTLGVLLFHFKTVNPFSSIFTVIAFPLVLLILLLGFAKLTLVWLLPNISTLLGLTGTYFAGLLSALVKWLAEFPGAVFVIGAVPLEVILVYYGALLLTVAQVPWRFRKVKFILVLILLPGVFLTMATLKYRRTHRDDLRLCCFSLADGQSILVSMPGGVDLLFDAGSGSVKNPGEKVIVPALNHLGFSGVDAVFVSHDDMDHLNGLPEVLGHIKTGGVYVNRQFLNAMGESATARHLSGAVEKAGLKLEADVEFFRDAVLTLPAEIEILWPVAGQTAGGQVSDNDNSQVVLISFGGRKIMICGDIQYPAQHNFVKMYPDLQVDVLVLPHHGSTRDTMPGFVEKLSPEVIIASCSRKRYEQTIIGPAGPNMRAYYTAVDGMISVHVNVSGEINVETFTGYEEP